MRPQSVYPFPAPSYHSWTKLLDTWTTPSEAKTPEEWLKTRFITLFERVWIQFDTINRTRVTNGVERLCFLWFVSVQLHRFWLLAGSPCTIPGSWKNGWPTWSWRTGLRPASPCCAWITSRNSTSTDRGSRRLSEKTPFPPSSHPPTTRREKRFVFTELVPDLKKNSSWFDSNSVKCLLWPL